MLSRYYQLNKLAGINITVEKDGNVRFDACMVSVESSQLKIDQRVSSLHDINDLKKHFPEKTVVTLNLVGKGVFTKLVSNSSNGKLAFGSVLPNAHEDEFYVQQVESGPNSFVSAVRKQDADKWIEQLQGLGYVPVSLSLGPFTVMQIVPQLNVYEAAFTFDGHIIERNDQVWTNYTYQQSALAIFPFKIENEKIDEAMLLPYASAFQLAMYPKIALINTNANGLLERLASTMEMLKFKANGFIVLACFFVLLLFNFIFLTYFTSSNTRLAEQIGQSVADEGRTRILSESLQEQRHLLELVGWEGRTDKSLLIDQIAQLLPQTVKWQQVAVDPLEPTASSAGSIDKFMVRLIKITGTSKELIPVNEWIARIKTKPWVKQVQLQSYTFNYESDTGQFTVTIQY